MTDIFDLVSYEHTRARGTIAWHPTHETRRTLDRITGILNEYRDYLPMTARQIYYRLVGQNAIPKTEQAYARLLSILTKARRAGVIPFSAIRDDGTVAQLYRGWRDPQQWIDSVKDSAERFERDLRQDQDREVEVWVEAAGMVPQVAQAVAEYGVSVYSSGGFDSLTVKHDAARRIRRNPRRTVVLHVGDLDPSGVALFNAVREDVDAFLLDWGVRLLPQWNRIAINLDQIEQYELETAPPKQRKDAQNLPGGWAAGWPTVQAEAFAPDVLINLITSEVRSRLDLEAIEEVRGRSRVEAARLVDALDRLEI